MTQILIAVPTHRHMIDMGTAVSLASVSHMFGVDKIPIAMNNIDSADIAHARNLAAMGLLSDPKFTHLLFVDSDMVFKSSLVAQLLRAKKEVIGCVYPRRLASHRNALDKVAQAGRAHADDNAAIGSAAGFIPDDVREYKFVDGIAEVGVIGMGLCLIARSVFEKLIATGKVPQMKVLSDVPYNFFQQITRGEIYYGEDASFCLRWRELCGGKVYALASSEIAHIARVEVRATPA